MRNLTLCADAAHRRKMDVVYHPPHDVRDCSPNSLAILHPAASLNGGAAFLMQNVGEDVGSIDDDRQQPKIERDGNNHGGDDGNPRHNRHPKIILGCADHGFLHCSKSLSRTIARKSDVHGKITTPNWLGSTHV